MIASTTAGNSKEKTLFAAGCAHDVVIQRRQTIWQCQSKLVFIFDD